MLNSKYTGIDWDAPLPTDYSDNDDTQTVSVEAPLNPLTEEQYSELQATLPPVVHDSAGDYGITLYLDCVRFVQIRLVFYFANHDKSYMHMVNFHSS